MVPIDKYFISSSMGTMSLSYTVSKILLTVYHVIVRNHKQSFQSLKFTWYFTNNFLYISIHFLANMCYIFPNIVFR